MSTGRRRKENASFVGSRRQPLWHAGSGGATETPRAGDCGRQRAAYEPLTRTDNAKEVHEYVVRDMDSHSLEWPQ